MYSGVYIYEGDWKEGLMHGQGVMVDLAKRRTYEGRFLNDLKDGTGTITERWGGKIYGQWVEGEFNGICTYSFAGFVKDVVYSKGEVLSMMGDDAPDGLKLTGTLSEQLRQWWRAVRKPTLSEE